MPYAHIKTLELRKGVCLACPNFKKESELCGLDNQAINMKLFLDNCPLNKWPIEVFHETHQSKKNKPKEPPLNQKIKSLSRAVYRWAKSGFLKSGKKLIEQRLDICKKCEFWDSEAWNGSGKCTKCGCSTYAKIRLKTEKCPIEKW
jgi:hypothetical protein